MRVFTVLVALLIVGAGTTGCSVVGPAMGYGVNEICAAEPAERVVLRAAVDQAVSPHRLRVYCHKDFLELPENSLIE